MSNWRICKECGTMFHPRDILNTYCSRECQLLNCKKNANRRNKEWRNKNPEKAKLIDKRSRKIKKDYYIINNEIDRYLLHRQKIFTTFIQNQQQNNETGIIDRWKDTPIWKQRIEQMDTIFVDELINNTILFKINIETMINTLLRKIKVQNIYFEQKANDIINI